MGKSWRQWEQLDLLHLRKQVSHVCRHSSPREQPRTNLGKQGEAFLAVVSGCSSYMHRWANLGAKDVIHFLPRKHWSAVHPQVRENLCLPLREKGNQKWCERGPWEAADILHACSPFWEADKASQQYLAVKAACCEDKGDGRVGYRKLQRAGWLLCHCQSNQLTWSASLCLGKLV